MEAPTCTYCNVLMTEGCIPDFTHSRIITSSWMEGKPEKSKWLSNLVTENKVRFRITAYRCGECGRIESFALDRQY